MMGIKEGEKGWPSNAINFSRAKRLKWLTKRLNQKQVNSS